MASDPDDYSKNLQRFRSDFEFYAPRALKIIDKSGQLVPFALNKSQLYAHNKIENQIQRQGLVRKIILKGRQQGFCLSPDTNVMRSDFTWSKIGDLLVGDELIGIDENLGEKQKAGCKATRRMRTTVVEEVHRFQRELFEITLSDGRVLKSTAEHRWAMKQRGGCYVQWRATKDAKAGDFIRAAAYAPDHKTPSFEDGWAAGVLDADGSCSITKAARVGFSQVAGGVLTRYKKYLNDFGIHWYENIDTRTKVGKTTKLGNKPVHCIRVDRLPDIMRLLGRARTERFSTKHIYEGRKLPTSSKGFEAWIEIVSIKSIGVSEVVDIQTSCKTFIAEGLVSHNSTYTQGRFYWKVSGSFGKKAFILTHLDEATTNLFNMGKRFHDYCPSSIKPSTRNKSEKSLYFDRLDSGYSVGTARSDGTGRSGTFQYFHGSEAAFWRNAPIHMAGIGQTLPYLPGTESLLESTANGIGNMFHEIWQDATNGIGDYEPIFIPWYWQFEYQRPVPSGFVLDAEEAEYMETYDLTLPQMVWRRFKVNTDFRSNVSLFAQEYPATPEEAFMASIEGTLINPQKIQLAVKNHGKLEGYGPRLMGVDPAEYGEDDTAFSYRQGATAEEPETFHGINQMQIAGLVAMRLDQKRIDKCMVDTSGGWGGGVVARLGELGFGSKVIRVNFGENAIDKESYGRRRDEMWGDMADWFDGDEPVSIPDNKRLQAELSSPKYDLDSSRRLKLESKEQMKKRGIKSPDIADSLALTFAYKYSNTSPSSTNHRPAPNWRAM